MLTKYLLRYFSRSKDLYKVLGISKDSNQSQVKAAYIKLVQEHHPDKNTGSDTTEKFKEINELFNKRL